MGVTDLSSPIILWHASRIKYLRSQEKYLKSDSIRGFLNEHKVHVNYEKSGEMVLEWHDRETLCNGVNSPRFVMSRV